MTDNSHSSAVLALLADYLGEQAQFIHHQLGDVAGIAITMRIAGAPLTIGTSSELALDVDLIQYEIGIGPCLFALQNGVVLYVPDLAGDDRWGEYGPRAAARGALSCLSVPVKTDGAITAVLKAYASCLDGLSVEQRTTLVTRAGELAGGIGLALSLSDHAQQLDDRIAAMDHRHLIDLGVGMVMERLRCGPAQAFALLRRQSQQSGRKLYDVARELVAAVSDADDGGSAPFSDRGAAPFSDRGATPVR